MALPPVPPPPPNEPAGGAGASGRSFDWQQECNAAFTAEEQGIVLALFGGASLIDRSTHDLIVTRADPAYPLGPNNCVLLTQQQAQKLHDAPVARKYFSGSELARLREVSSGRAVVMHGADNLATACLCVRDLTSYWLLHSPYCPTHPFAPCERSMRGLMRRSMITVGNRLLCSHRPLFRPCSVRPRAQQPGSLMVWTRVGINSDMIF